MSFKETLLSKKDELAKGMLEAFEEKHDSFMREYGIKIDDFGFYVNNDCIYEVHTGTACSSFEAFKSDYNRYTGGYNPDRYHLLQYEFICAIALGKFEGGFLESLFSLAKDYVCLSKLFEEMPIISREADTDIEATINNAVKEMEANM